MLSIQWLVQGAAALLLWLPLQHRFECARLMQHSMISINIRCLRCGYAMSGLEHLRCPECGEEFTIDELLRGQPLVSGGEGSVERLPAQTISASVPTGAS
jgi:DNA-directed RNA polymerase subunit RPC12/RpoP